MASFHQVLHISIALRIKEQNFDVSRQLQLRRKTADNKTDIKQIQLLLIPRGLSEETVTENPSLNTLFQMKLEAYPQANILSHTTLT